jgi:hypothetical protein
MALTRSLHLSPARSALLLTHHAALPSLAPFAAGTNGAVL